MKKLYEARASKLKYFVLSIVLIVGCFTVTTAYQSTHSVKSTIEATAGVGSIAAFPLMFRFAPEEGGEQGGEAAIAEKVRGIAKEQGAKSGKEAAEAAYKKLLDDYPQLASLKTIEAALAQKSTKEDFDAIKKMCEEIGLKVEGLTEEGKDFGKKNAKNLQQALENAFAAKKSEIESIIKDGQKASLKIDVKAIDMGVQNTIGAGDTQYTITQNTGIISTIRKRELTYLANVSVGSITTDRALWVEELDESGTPIMLAEAAGKTQLSVRYEEKDARVKKIAVFGKVTTEMLADLPQLISYIQNNLMKRMDIVLEDNFFNGDGTGDNLIGLDSYAQAFDGGGLLAIDDANEYDVIEALALQVALAYGSANAVFVHPSTVSRMKLLKDDNGQYIYPRWASADGLNVAGLKVIPTTAVTAGEFIGGDLSVVNVLKRDELGITIGLDGNDFTNNKKTMLMEKRYVQFVSANDVNLIVKGVFTDAEAVIEALT